jgi:hypothetical protein
VPLDRAPAGRLRLVGTAGVPHELPALNADEKTVVRLTVDRSSMTEPFARALAPRLLLVPALKLADRRARSRFADRFARLTDKRSRRRVSALTGAAGA